MSLLYLISLCILAIWFFVPFAAFRMARQSRSEIKQLRKEILSLSRQLDELQPSKTAQHPAPAPAYVAQDNQDEALSALDIATDLSGEAKQQQDTSIPPDTNTAFQPKVTSLPHIPSGTDAWNSPSAVTKKTDAETALATRWSVWVGGLALALGGLLIIRYSIEAGFFGPRMRLMLGGLFAVTMAIASEIIRRGHIKISANNDATRHIPAILAGVSVLTGFGVIYAAHAIYGFVTQTTAFLGLGLIGLGALVWSRQHGPALGLVGLAGSYATPILIGGESGNKPALTAFIIIVTLVAMTIQKRNVKPVLLTVAAAGHAAWTALLALPGEFDPIYGHILLLAGMAGPLLNRLKADRDGADKDIHQQQLWRAQLFAFAAPVILAGFIWVQRGGGLPTQAVLGIILIAAAWFGILFRGLAALVPLAAAAATGMVLFWPALAGAPGISPVRLFELVALRLPQDHARGMHLFAVILSLAITSPALFSLQKRDGNGAGGIIPRGMIAFGAALLPVAMLLAVALRSIGLTQSISYSLAAAALGLLLGAASEIIFRSEAPVQESDNTLPVASAAFASAGAVAGGLAVAFALRELWLFVGLALASAGVAIIASRRPIPLLRSMAAALATAALLRVLWQPALSDLGSWIILNWLLPAYALPAAAFGLGAWALRNRKDKPFLVLAIASALFVAVFVLLEIRHAFHGPNIRLHPGFTIAESGFYAGFALIAAYLVSELRSRFASGTQWAGQWTELSAAGVGSAIIAMLMAFVDAQGQFSGSILFNNAFVGLLMPAIVAGLIAVRLLQRPKASQAFRIYGLFAVLTGLLFVFSQIRISFPEADWSMAWASDRHRIRLFAYSIAMIAYGGIMLAAGFYWRLKDLRLAALGIIALAAFKVFMVDLSGLQGLWRAASFIGLGLSLMGIAEIYRRMHPAAKS